MLQEVPSTGGGRVIQASHAVLGDRWLYTSSDAPLLFTENETNNERLFHGQNASSYTKDGINDYVIGGRQNAVDRSSGTKVAVHQRFTVKGKDTVSTVLRLSTLSPDQVRVPLQDANTVFAARLREADEFYRSITPTSLGADEASVMRQAFAGMLWSKQHYFFDVNCWLEEHGADPFSASTRDVRNREWSHMVNDHVISMPDKWEYPWYAAWDLALSGPDTWFTFQTGDRVYNCAAGECSQSG